MRVGSMFAGIGGADLAIKQVMGARTAWQLDIVGAAVRRRHWPDAEQVERDVTAVDPATLPPVDVIAAGFPCQDLSCAGKGAGLEGAKSGLYREVLRFAARIAPRYVVMENVSGLLPYMPRLCADFAGLGYGLAWTTCRAIDAGHPHLRRRVFVVAERGAPLRGLIPCPAGGGQERPWPTPLVRADQLQPGALGWEVRPWPTPTVRGNDNAAGLSPLSGDGLATACRPWPTPCTRDYKTGDLSKRRGTASPSQEVTDYPRGTWGSRLNPEWVEALMGYPMGWTSPTGSRLCYDPDAPAVRGRYPVGWDRSQVWPGHAWEPSRTIPDGPPVPGRPARIRALGNAWCPQQGALALATLLDVPAQASMW